MESFDAIVIGGSASGAPTAMLLARAGLKVLLVEKRTFPRDTLSTHFIWPRGVSYLNRWGLAARVCDKSPTFTDLELSVEDISLKGSVPLADLEARFQQLHGDTIGVTNRCCGPRRYFLDQVLLDAAKDAGVDVREGVTFTQPLVEDGAVKGIEAVRTNGATLSAKSQLVIGADGRFSPFARQVGARTLVLREQSTFAYWGYFSDVKKIKQAIYKKGRLGVAMFPTSDGAQMALAYGPTDWWNAFRTKAEENFFKVFAFCAPEFEEALRAANRVERFKACSSMPAFQREVWGKNWVLLGDAAGFHDQVTAMGQTHAFRDAQLLVDCVSEAFSGESTMDEALACYAARRAEDYNDYFEFSCRTAEMNPLSAQELGFFYAIRNNQQQIEQLLSQFGDTLAFTKGEPFTGSVDNGFPAVLGAFGERAATYTANPFLSDTVTLVEQCA